MNNYYIVCIIIHYKEIAGDELYESSHYWWNRVRSYRVDSINKNHPHLEVGSVISNSQAGNNFSETYPHLSNIVNISLEKFDVNKYVSKIDIVFLATPSGVSSKLAQSLLDKGIKGYRPFRDFRLRSQNEYETWYKHTAPAEEYLSKAVYGLSEIYAEKIKEASLIANPGCYPTATTLGLLPILKANLAD